MYIQKLFTIDFTSVAMTKIFNNTERDSVLKTEREETRNKETGGGGSTIQWLLVKDPQHLLQTASSTTDGQNVAHVAHVATEEIWTSCGITFTHTYVLEVLCCS